MDTLNPVTLEQEIERLEAELLEAKQRLAGLRRQRPRQRMTDHELVSPDGDRLTLSDLFEGKDTLVLVHNMGARCRYCTMWADGINGLVPHLENRVSFVVESPDDHETMRKFAQTRGWIFRMVSSQGTTFRQESGFVDEDGDPAPGVSVFVREPDGVIHQVNRASFGPGDDFCPTWHFFDLLPGGAGDWAPKLHY